MTDVGEIRDAVVLTGRNLFPERNLVFLILSSLSRPCLHIQKGIHCNDKEIDLLNKSKYQTNNRNIRE